MDYIIIKTATDNYKEAKSISKNLVENKLASAVHIQKIESIYRWQNKVENIKEYTLSIRTIKSNFQKISDYIKNNHHYITPEILSIKIENGSPEFLSWIEENLGPLN